MTGPNPCRAPRWVFLALLGLPLIGIARPITQEAPDPHRPPCADSRCRKIRDFVRERYCGKTPWGNGPDDGCQIQLPKTHYAKVIANFHCEWNEAKLSTECQQYGKPTPSVGDILTAQLKRLGVSAEAQSGTYYVHLQPIGADSSVASAYWSRRIGKEELEECSVILFVGKDSKVVVLHEQPFQKDDIDGTKATEWSLVDLADTDGDGHAEVVLIGEEYENHWLEVIEVKDGVAKTLFSGLGYYL